MSTTTLQAAKINALDLSLLGFDLRLIQEFDGCANGSAIYPHGANLNRAQIEVLMYHGDIGEVFLHGGTQRLMWGPEKTLADLARLIQRTGKDS